MKLVLLGQVPSLKNAKKISVNPRTGQRFVRTEKRVSEYMQNAKLELSTQWKRPPLAEVENLTCIFFNQDARKRDLSNMLDTVCDICKTIVYEDDDCKCLPRIQVEYGGIDRDKPRVEIYVDF